MNCDQTLVKIGAMNREIPDNPLEISPIKDKQTKTNFTGKSSNVPMKPEKQLQNGKIKTRSNIEILVSGKENHNTTSKSNTNKPHKNRKGLTKIVIVATTQETTFYSEESTLAAKPTLIRGEQIWIIWVTLRYELNKIRRTLIRLLLLIVRNCAQANQICLE